MAVILKAGDKAPNFKVKDQNNVVVKLADLKGKKAVIFFYPADMTPTCTVEACNLRDNYESFQKKGYEVYGVSPDNAKSHLKFIERHGLPYRLLSDENNKMAIAFGVWDEKVLFGKKYMGILRTTFILDKKGIIEEVITKVRSKEHADQILKEA